MRTIAIALSVFLIAAGSFAAEQTSAGATSKLAAMLAAKDEQGQPIITPEERAYFDGLNDNLKELLTQAAQKETDHATGALGDAVVAAIAPAKDGVASPKQLRPVPQRFRKSICRYAFLSRTGRDNRRFRT